jgi:hypothetical protein
VPYFKIIYALMAVVARPVFSGHDTFQCRHLWLKKGYDYIKAGKSFGAEDAVVELGVGKNMVTSIRYWMRAFDLSEGGEKLTGFAEAMFSDEKGHDPYLEDDASLWLLHYHLIRKGYATTYNLIFNELRKERVEFSKEAFLRFMRTKSETDLPFVFNSNTIESDFDVFVKLYIGTETTKEKEEIVSGIFPELNLVRVIQREKQPPLYHIETNEKVNIPEEVILYAIVTDPDIGLSVSLDTLEKGYNNVGAIFGINRTGLVDKIERLCDKYPGIVYKDDAGVRELQFKKKLNWKDILKDYYEKQI